MNIGILGGGSWAIGLSVLLHKRGHTIAMWEFNEDDARMLARQREHSVKLPGIYIPDSILITSDLLEMFKKTEYVICAVPAQRVRSALTAIVGQIPHQMLDAVAGWIIVSKGIECTTLNLLSDVFLQILPGCTADKLAVLSGPSHAEEVSREIPTTVVAASGNRELAEKIQREFSTESFRIHTNDDIVGVELAGSTKNVIALAAGICDGLGFGDNTKGALLTRGIVEMTRLGVKLGARSETFWGLAGIGDLITTCISRHSRNRRFGELIASGLSPEQALEKMTMVAEGVDSTRSVYRLARQNGVDMPITAEIYKTLFEGKMARQAVRDLMVRDPKRE